MSQAQPSTLMIPAMYCWIYQALMYLALPLIQRIYMPLLLICRRRHGHHLEQHLNFAGLRHHTWSGFLNITGTSGADSLAGNGETNTINGGGGNDLLGVSSTPLIAHTGDDRLNGGNGDDDLGR